MDLILELVRAQLLPVKSLALMLWRILHWTMCGGEMVPAIMGEVGSSLMLGPLVAGDSGSSYTCEVTVSDNFLSSPITTVSAAETIRVFGEYA